MEGWALYTERLADEMGLYETDLDRLGMLASDSWRACRLVVDTGLHAMGWTRQQAIDFMVAHAGRAATRSTVEVDRYIGMPGQALAYKVGQRRSCGCGTRPGPRSARFDIKGFHDAVLGGGDGQPAGAGDRVAAWAGRQARGRVGAASRRSPSSVSARSSIT